MPKNTSLNFDEVKKGGKTALAQALAVIESAPDDEATLNLLSQAHGNPTAHVIGITGPPGVGKSTLMGALISQIREKNLSLGIIAVDPSSQRSGGALLGDRIRLATDPADKGLFVRSMAARDRLGGLAAISYPAMVLMRAIFDVVLIETVGVGQSEVEIEGVCDTVVFCVQPGSGDSLQFMKAGIIEIPDIMVVTKSDMGAPARSTQADLRSALQVTHGRSGSDDTTWRPQVLGVWAPGREGILELIESFDAHAAWLDGDGRLSANRRAQDEAWLLEAVRDHFGRLGVKKAGDLSLKEGESPFRRLSETISLLSAP